MGFICAALALNGFFHYHHMCVKDSCFSFYVLKVVLLEATKNFFFSAKFEHKKATDS